MQPITAILTPLRWEVIEAELGVSHDDVHRAIGKQQKDGWAEFMESVEKRKPERDGKA